MKLYSADQAKAIDTHAISTVGISAFALMETAGRAVAQRAMEMVRGAGPKVLVLVGKGNNGGDGLVAARALSEAGATVRVLLSSAFPPGAGPAAQNLAAVRALGIPVDVYPGEGPICAAAETPGLCIDALLGIGAKGAPAGALAEIVRAANALPCPLLAVDIPTGLDASTGETPGECIHAAATVTFGMGKIGLFGDPGIRMAGAVDVVDIGFPRMSMETVRPTAWRLDAAMVANWLPERPLDSNKGTFGSAVIVAGSAGMLGAATLCARAALRAGAGLVRLAVPASLLSLANTLTPEVVCCPVSDGGTGLFAPEALESILELARSARAVAIGPGLTTSAESGRLLKELLPRLRAPVVLDADGLNLLAAGMASLENRQAPTLLTPHPGEMGRLAGMDVKSVQARRLAVAGDLARKLEAVIVLKGLATVIASPAGDLLLNSTGNPGMASAGMGDALTGALVGLLAQGMDPFQAAGCAVYLHGLAGDLSAVSRGDAGLLSSDIVDALPRARRITKEVGTAEANTH